MFHTIVTRSFRFFSFILLLITLLPLLFLFFLRAGKIPEECVWSAVLSFINVISAAYFAVSGKEGTFRRLMSSIFFRLISLIVVFILVILKGGVDPLILMISFILFFLLHQISLIVWLKFEIHRTKSDLSPQKRDF